MLYTTNFYFFTLSILGKAKNSGWCHNCRATKTKVINIDREVYERCPELWALINLCLLGDGVVYDSSSPKYLE